MLAWQILAGAGCWPLMSAVADVHVGKAGVSWCSPVLEERTRVHFHNFADLQQKKGERIRSSTFTCGGHEWDLRLYPRGDRDAKEGMISIFLGIDSASKIGVDFDIMLKKKTGDNIRVKSATKDEFPWQNNAGWGWRDYVSRDKIVDASNNVLNNGTLTFEVRIRPENYCRRDAIPKPSFADDLSRIYQDDDTVDVAFKVEMDVFHAHKAILKARVPELAELAEPYDTENPIPIKDVEPEIFESMLKHVYGKDIDESYWGEHAKKILDASGKYGFTQLKSEAETWHVKNIKQNLTVDNAVDELLYADGMNCPLLKKASMDFIVEHGEEVIDSDSYEKLDKSPELRKDFVKAAFSSKKRKLAE
eukprot:scaffold55148_cov49-Cyclotella_meneghiniana.AAC.12